LCGHDNFDRVALVTTKWAPNKDQSAFAAQENRENQLIRKRWKEMADAGSIVERHDGSQGSAAFIVRKLLLNSERAPYKVRPRHREPKSREPSTKAPDARHITESRWPFIYHFFCFIAIPALYDRLSSKIFSTPINGDLEHRITLMVWCADIFYLLFELSMVQHGNIPILYN
jgi:hypothetical protein